MATTKSTQPADNSGQTTEKSSTKPISTGSKHCRLSGNVLALWDDYLVAARDAAPETRRAYQRWAGRFLDHVDNVADITLEDLVSFQRRLMTEGLSNSSRRQATAALKSFCSWAHDTNRLAHDPSARLRAPRRYQEEAPYLTATEAAKLVYGPEPGMIEARPVDARNRVLVAVAYFAGLRVGEAVALKMEDLHLAETGGYYSVRIRRGKRARRDYRRAIRDRMVSAMITVYLELRNEIKDAGVWLFPSSRGGQLTERQAERIFHRMRLEAGIHKRGRRLSFHILRHSVATHLLREGRELPDIGRWLRHEHLGSTFVYSHAAGEQTLARRLFAKDPLKPDPRTTFTKDLFRHLVTASGHSGSF